jgi:Trypsin-like peptidase domain/FHA domain
MRNMNRWSMLLTSAATLTILSGAATAQTDSDVFKPVVDSSVRVLAMMSDGSARYGTGWVISAADKQNNAGAAVIVTAGHVVAGAVKVTVVESGSAISDQRIGTVIGSTPERDLAFVEVKGITQPALTLTRATPNLGDQVAAVGYASASDANETNGRASRGSLKVGHLSKDFQGSMTDNSAPIDQVEFDAPVLGGFSGGPLVNLCGMVLGVTVKDGGHIAVSEGEQIATAQGIAVAVASDEVIKAARDNRVSVQAIDAACPVNEKPVPPPPVCSAPFISTEHGQACTPIQPNQIQSIVHNLGGPTGVTMIVAGAALLVVGGTVLAVVGGRRKPLPPGGGATGQGGGTAPGGGGISILSPPPPPPRSRTIRLTGRGPSNEAIDLKFDANELVGSGVMLGVEGDEGARIPDNRPKTFVSRRHASLSYDGRNFLIIDNKSANKTKVGGEALPPSTPRPLVSGDRLELADVVLNVLID